MTENNAHEYVGAQVVQLVNSISHMFKVNACIALKEQLRSLNSIMDVLSDNYVESNHSMSILCGVPLEEACVGLCLEK